MKRIIFIILAFILIISCAPSRHTIHVEMRHASKSGLDLAGKNITAVYYIGDIQLDNELVDTLVNGFATSLENDFQTGKGSIAVMSMDRTAGDYTTRDSLINLLKINGGDVVFLFDVTFSNSTTSGMRPIKVSMYCYDGMNKEDVVKKYVGNAILQSNKQEELLSEAVKSGTQIAESFKSQWKHEQYSIAYYDSSQWIEALVLAEQFDWKGAMDIWMTMLDSSDPLKRAAAEYNIGVACYMLGDFHLAKLWIDRSEAESKMPTLSEAMQKRIQSRLL